MRILRLKIYALGFLIPALCCSIFCISLSAQEPVSRQLTDEDGLPSMTVYEILQDDLGFMWMGTANGICKYDGRSFTTFPDSLLNDNEILKIRKDSWNRIWFFNLSGQLAYIENDQIIPFYKDSMLTNKKVWNIYIGIQNLCIVYRGNLANQFGILCYRLSQNRQAIVNNLSIENFKNKIDLIDQGETIILKEISIKNDFNSKNNIPIFKKKESQIEDIGLNIQPYYFATIKAEHEIKKDIVINDHRFIKVSNIPYSTKYTNIKFIDTTLWIPSSNGIWNAPLNQKLNILLPAQKIFENINANDIILDREDNYWITTTSQGVRIVPSLSMQFLNTLQGNLPNDEVYRLFYDSKRDRIISGHANGKIAIHQNNQSPKIIDLKIKGRVLDIAQNHLENFYFVIDNGIIVLDSKLNFKFQNLTNHGPKTIIEDSQHRIWIGVAHHFLLTNHTLNSLDKKNAQKKRTYAIHEDISKRIWLGTTEGLYLYQDDTSKLYLKDNITSISESTDSTLWVSTKTNGILGIKNNQTIHHFTIKNGLVTNQCKRIFWDGKLLWIATNKGLNYLDPKTQKLGLINKKDGLPSDEVYDVLVVKNRVWVGTPKGLVHFPKDIIHHNAMPPPIYLRSLDIWDKEYPLDSTIEVAYDQNNLQFNFIGLGFKAKNAISYKYKLSGVDQDWVYTNNSFARYPVVNPGIYQFEVYAINEDQVKSLQPAKISIRISPAWWQRDWIKVLAALVLIFIINSILQYRFRKNEEKKSTQNKINQLKQQALQAQMNPHFIFNVLGAIQKSLATNNKESAMLYLSRFSRMIRSIFDYSKQKEISLEEEIEFLKLYLELEKLRFKNKITIEFTVDPILRDYYFDTKIPPLLLQPLIENAFKHGLFHKEDQGTLKINFTKENQFLNFTIEDNGIGRKKAQSINKKKWFYKPHQSSGIRTIKERLQIINHSKNSPYSPTLEINDLYQQDTVVGTKVSLLIFCNNFN